jgi:hypothetical protein
MKHMSNDFATEVASTAKPLRPGKGKLIIVLFVVGLIAAFGLAELRLRFSSTSPEEGSGLNNSFIAAGCASRLIRRNS